MSDLDEPEPKTWWEGQRVRLKLEGLMPPCDDAPDPCFAHIVEIGPLALLDGELGILCEIWNPLPDGQTGFAFMAWCVDRHLEAVD